MTTRTEVKKQAGDAPLGIGISLIVLSVIFGILPVFSGGGIGSPAAGFMLVLGALLTVIAYLIRLRR